MGWPMLAQLGMAALGSMGGGARAGQQAEIDSFPVSMGGKAPEVGSGGGGGGGMGGMLNLAQGIAGAMQAPPMQAPAMGAMPTGPPAQQGQLAAGGEQAPVYADPVMQASANLVMANATPMPSAGQPSPPRLASNVGTGATGGPTLEGRTMAGLLDQPQSIPTDAGLSAAQMGGPEPLPTYTPQGAPSQPLPAKGAAPVQQAAASDSLSPEDVEEMLRNIAGKAPTIPPLDPISTKTGNLYGTPGTGITPAAPATPPQRVPWHTIGATPGRKIIEMMQIVAGMAGGGGGGSLPAPPSRPTQAQSIANTKNQLANYATTTHVARAKNVQYSKIASPAKKQEFLMQSMQQFAGVSNKDMDDPLVQLFGREMSKGFDSTYGQDVAETLKENPDIAAGLGSPDREKFLAAHGKLQEQFKTDAIDDMATDGTVKKFSDGNKRLAERAEADPSFDYPENPTLEAFNKEKYRLGADAPTATESELMGFSDENQAVAGMRPTTSAAAARKKRAEGEVTKELKDDFGDPFINKLGDLVQENLNTGELKKLSTRDSGVPGYAAGKPKPSELLALKKDFQLQSKNFQEITEVFKKAEAARELFYNGEDPGGLNAWQTLNVVFQKSIDPTSVVRESEFARTEGFMGFMDRLAFKLEKFQSGKATPEIIEDVFANIEVLKNAAQDGQRRRKANYEKIATGFWGEGAGELVTGAIAPPEKTYRLDPETQTYIESN